MYFRLFGFDNFKRKKIMYRMCSLHVSSFKSVFDGLLTQEKDTTFIDVRHSRCLGPLENP